jgi:hypothetical protein
MRMIVAVVEVSEDGKKVRCKTCKALRGYHGHDGGWIQKESLAYHLKSDAHTRSISAQQSRELIQTAGEQSLEDESAMEQEMDFVMLSATVKHPVTVTARAHVPSTEEREMWDNHTLFHNLFDAGIDPAAAAADERKRLEREATNFDLWHGADFLPEEDPNDGELLLEELEQDDILMELLRNARMYYSPVSQFSIPLSIFGQVWTHQT